MFLCVIIPTFFCTFQVLTISMRRSVDRPLSDRNLSVRKQVGSSNETKDFLSKGESMTIKKLLICSAITILALVGAVAALASQPPPECGCPCMPSWAPATCMIFCGSMSTCEVDYLRGGAYSCDPCAYLKGKTKKPILESFRKAGCFTRFSLYRAGLLKLRRPKAATA